MTDAQSLTGDLIATEGTVLDRKVNEHFAGVVVRKDLVKAVKGNAIVPSYVLEYLLGQYAASDDESTIQAGIDTVRKILADHYVHRNESELVKSTIRERGRYKIIDRVTVALNEKDDVYEATFANLGIKQVVVESATITAHPKLLVGGVWCICDISISTQITREPCRGFSVQLSRSSCRTSTSRATWLRARSSRPTSGPTY